MSWTVATFNANSLRARLPVVTRWLESAKPDVLAVQETKVQDKDFPREPLEALGYHVVFHGQKSYNGVAILSRQEPESWTAGLGDGVQEPEEARLIVARFPGITVVNSYVPQGRDVDSPKFPFKLEWFQRIRAYLEANHDPGEPLLWTGDLNVAYQDMDVHDPKRLLGHVCFHPEVTKAFLEVMDWGLVDVFRKHRPEPGEFSFWDYRTRGALQRGLGWRIDHLLATPALAELSQDAWVDTEPRTWEKPSDHTFVLGRFDL